MNTKKEKLKNTLAVALFAALFGIALLVVPNAHADGPPGHPTVNLGLTHSSGHTVRVLERGVAQTRESGHEIQSDNERMVSSDEALRSLQGPHHP